MSARQGALGLCGVLVTMVSSGCYNSTIVTSTPPVAAMVRVDFLAPRELLIQGSAGSVRIAQVTSVRGTVERAAPDSVYLRIASVTTSSGAAEPPPGGRVAVAFPDPGLQMGRSTFSGSRTAATLIVLAAIPTVIFVIALGHAVRTAPV